MNKKNLIGISGLLLGMAMALHSSEVNFPKLTGPYLGKKPPGMTPIIFAPGIISTELHDDGPPVFHPNGNEIFFRVVGHVDGKPRGVIFYMQKKNNTWTLPRIAPFSGDYMDGGVFLSPDSQTIYFSSQRSPHPGSQSSEETKIWIRNFYFL